MKLEDAIFNWLQITVVNEARPDDLAAKETSEFFREILTQDHNVEQISYERDPFKYLVTYSINGNEEKRNFDLMLVDKLLVDIENEPKYN